MEIETQAPDFWNDSDRARKLLGERATCERIVNAIARMRRLADDSEAALELAKEVPNDTEIENEVQKSFQQLEIELNKLEFSAKMSGDFDHSNAIIEINAGSGGTEAQDWALMLLRMYLRWVERHGFAVEELDYQAGEGAGIKSTTILVSGDYAYGHLRSEQGVHRLVRISPFDSNARRHTSFASVAVTPDIEEDVTVEIRDEDLRVDTYRSGGAGGQHVNKTDSAVRLTHIPTGIVVACQSQRSQHKNRDRAMKLLKAKLLERERLLQKEKMDEIKGERKKIDFGSQIRSYVLHPYQMVKDLRTDFETSQADKVLDGDIDGFIQAYLMSDA